MSTPSGSPPPPPILPSGEQLLRLHANIIIDCLSSTWGRGEVETGAVVVVGNLIAQFARIVLHSFWRASLFREGGQRGGSAAGAAAAAFVGLVWGNKNARNSQRT